MFFPWLFILVVVWATSGEVRALDWLLLVPMVLQDSYDRVLRGKKTLRELSSHDGSRLRQQNWRDN